MASLKWCKKQQKGLKRITPSAQLAEAYLTSAKETVIVLKEITDSNMWKATTQYYALYFIVYAMLMHLGIKSEIHECTIIFSSKLEDEGLLPQGTSKRLEQEKQLRIDNQYYLKNYPITTDTELMSLLLATRKKIREITNDEVERIREKYF
ncbi:hypothetical protein GOV07_02095 [Candidatus Woesearchaeota archaeon]|nr:hypothetical protein [Candidatus Woesearchaeota archaeon]